MVLDIDVHQRSKKKMAFNDVEKKKLKCKSNNISHYINYTSKMNFQTRAQPKAKEEKSTLQKIKETPAFAVGTQVALFGLGVLFIQSPLMDMLVPQL